MMAERALAKKVLNWVHKSYKAQPVNTKMFLKSSLPLPFVLLVY